jgi:hypothetical protein
LATSEFLEKGCENFLTITPPQEPPYQIAVKLYQNCIVIRVFTKQNIAMKVSILALFLSVSTAVSNAQVNVGVSVRIGPPPLPVYVQPPCPVDGYLWTPGYWAYDDADGYYWVPGAWIAPPRPNYLWTPGYWAYNNGFYGFHRGYWGPHIGYYGGINYGFGYVGVGFVGGGWYGGRFRYNTAVTNVNTTVVHNTYINRTVINNTTVSRTSFNGPGGVSASPRPQERAAMNERHIDPTGQQLSHQTMAHNDKGQFANANNGTPHTSAVSQVSNRPFSQQARTPNGGMQHQANGFGRHNNATPQQQAQPNHTQMSGPPNAAQAHQQQREMIRQQRQQQHQASQNQGMREPQRQPMHGGGGFGQPRGGGGGGRPAGGGHQGGGHAMHG